MDKAQLRAQAREARRALTPEERQERSDRIRAHVLALPELARARAVGCYVSVRSEVDTGLLLRELFARGIVVAVPVTLGESLVFARLNHPWALAPGAHGVPEPRRPWEEVPGDELDIILVPGVQFGRDGSRLGNGGGHFDRYLAAHPKALRVGLAFAVQLVDRLDTEAHDQAMDLVVTEEGRVRTGRPA
ncbi:MAG TPA: 5-formyltetrahydrofolate cyclo-ligase [Candidatus Thermoplasmatota archaeon]|nr:5-formyltetrahydrofolate cyclo-ligase [Candidatus Thermoplasmatota archaeon]